MRYQRFPSTFWLMALGLGLCPSFLNAQPTSVGSPTPREAAAPTQPKVLPAGTGTDYIAEVYGWDFMPASSSVTTAFTFIGAGAALRTTTAGTELSVGVHLPSGALIDFLELDACDASGTNDGSVSLFDCADGAGGPGGCTALVTVSTAGSAGCGFWASAAIGATVDNLNHDYVLDTVWPNDTNLGLRAVKVYYKLQVSPAPVTATFTDVPTTHPQFRYVEALHAAGITGGCGGGNYCPDSPLTRGQMAVFLSVALGLQWPN
jgi:hypothetical protein